MGKVDEQLRQSLTTDADGEMQQAAPHYAPHDLAKEDPEQLKHYYYMMLLMRRFEERTGEMYTKAKIGGYCHLNLGEEATVMGLMAAMQPEDYIYTNYREHGYMLARGADPGAVMAELFGKETGVSRGRGGSMHLFDRKSNFMGGYAIVGGQIPLALGAAFALKYKGEPGVAFCQMGDGTTNIGAWHESLNMAKLYAVPLVAFIVNNGYGMGTTVEKGSAEPDLYKKGCAFRMFGERVNGKDVLAVRDAVRRHREMALNGEPTILECVSYRLRGHSVVDPARYRSEEEVRAGRSEDPVQMFAKDLLDAQLVADAWLKETADRVEDEVQKAIDFAEQSPDPDIKELFTYMYATPVANTPGAEEALAAAREAGGEH
jgi:pyruvate dehydrogenase E1 component alpha subunit